MTVGGWSVPAWPWAYLMLFLALYGLGDLCYWAAGRLRRVWEWAWRDRVTPLFDEDDFIEVGPPWASDDLPPLPPERTWEQMTSHQAPVVRMSPAERRYWRKLERGRARRASAAERQARAHYVAMGFDFPSGLLARVREAAQ